MIGLRGAPRRRRDAYGAGSRLAHRRGVGSASPRGDHLALQRGSPLREVGHGLHDRLQSLRVPRDVGHHEVLHRALLDLHLLGDGVRAENLAQLFSSLLVGAHGDLRQRRQDDAPRVDVRGFELLQQQRRRLRGRRLAPERVPELAQAVRGDAREHEMRRAQSQAVQSGARGARVQLGRVRHHLRHSVPHLVAHEVARLVDERQARLQEPLLAVRNGSRVALS